tara:strand:- start:1199 stop:1720 length:522 start_codon:yes stop_codon:yes gene_type:complete
MTHPIRVLAYRKYWIAPVFISLLIAVPAGVLAKNNTVSAYDFVQKWTKTYGINHERAAEMMTTQHRGGMSKSEWVSTYGSYLEYLKYKHLGGQLISTQEEGHKARVILKSSVDSIQGPVVQHEIYDLLKVDGEWLIDFIDIRDENFGTSIGPGPRKKHDSKNNKTSPEHMPSQ